MLLHMQPAAGCRDTSHMHCVDLCCACACRGVGVPNSSTTTRAAVRLHAFTVTGCSISEQTNTGRAGPEKRKENNHPWPHSDRLGSVRSPVTASRAQEYVHCTSGHTPQAQTRDHDTARISTRISSSLALCAEQHLHACRQVD